MKPEADLLVISPGNNRVIYQDLAREYAAVEPPIWAGLLANFARSKGHSVALIDQEGEGLEVWQKPFTELRAPKITNLRMDPFERAEEEHAIGYQRWYLEHMFIIAPAGAYVGQWLQSFREFPPRQKPGSFNLDRVMESVSSGQPKSN